MAVLKLNYDQAERILELQGLRKWFDMKYGLADRLAGKPRQVLKAVDGVDPVSYTHLTLPTICSV